MNLRWLLFDYVPPELRFPRARRRELAQRIKLIRPRVVNKRRRYFIELPITFALAVAFCLGAVIVPMLERHLGALAVILMLFWYIMVWVAIATVFVWCNRRSAYVGLQSMGYDVCLACGYWLRGLGDEVRNCPECGAARAAMTTPPGRNASEAAT